jgi:hypothetical protein
MATKELSRVSRNATRRGSASEACAIDNQLADCYKRGASNLKECA